MSDDARHRDECLEKLIHLMKLNISIEQTCLGLLSDMVAASNVLSPEETLELVDRLHHQRAGLIKLKALAGAIGIDIETP